MKIIWSIFFTFFIQVSFAQSQELVKVLPETRVWLEGTSTVNEFTCSLINSTKIDLEVNSVRNTNSTGTHEGLTIKVGFPVKLLDCGKDVMNRDMYNALKSDEFPEITFELSSVEKVSDDEITESKLEVFRVYGILTVAGSSKSITLDTFASPPKLNEPHFLKGSYKIDMLDFGVTPPTALWGLIKADKDIDIHFEAEIEVADWL